MTRRVLSSGTVRLAAAALLAALLGAAPAAAEITVSHARGQTVLPGVPRRVVVFDLAALDTLDALGVPVFGVAGGAKPPSLARYNGPAYRRMGTLWEPDYEAVNEAEPDLIVVGGRSGPRYDALARMAPTIDLSSDAADPLGSEIRNIRTLARLFGKETEADARLARIEADIAAVRARAEKAGTALFVLSTGGRLSAFGPGSRFGLLHGALGFRPAAPGLGAGIHGQPISFEFVARTNPDWLFVLDRDAAIGAQGQPARQLLDNALVRQTTAWRQGRVVYVDAAAWYLAAGGLNALRTTVDGVAAALDGAAAALDGAR
ncbi:siderophore ABC transporter substrate-binding protein [Methylobacterium oryzihabitans]|uniref:Siderophore ABC transporter substrate-binding protein n=1 Tax=Methylobacterium oryzihabitans TaxID=2499852 RepID=A0A3S2VLK2_9HYPH|nr:siderophore ABC transporter substrate-binding protein [Methylobacterium oryzihabitans]RVU15626.1 siderophore ABC transporter substrate-binding protein [Methylobacterium oryzihabitans]